MNYKCDQSLNKTNEYPMENEKMLERYQHDTKEVENILNELQSMVEDKKTDIQFVKSSLEFLFKYYCFCSCNNITDSIPFPFDLIMCLFENPCYFVIFPMFFTLFEKIPDDIDISEYFFEIKGKNSLPIIFYAINDETQFQNIEFQGNLCDFVLKIITCQEKFDLFCENGFIQFIQRNIPTNFVISATLKLLPFMNEEIMLSIFSMYLSNLDNCYDELALCNIIKFLKDVYEKVNNPQMFNFDETIKLKFFEYINPKNQDLAYQALNFVVLAFESFNYSCDFLTFLPNYYEEDCVIAAVHILNKFYNEWSKIISIDEMKNLWNSFDDMEFITAVSLLPVLLRYNKIGSDAENDILAIKLCEKFCGSSNDINFFENILVFAVSMIEFYFINVRNCSSDLLDEMFESLSNIYEELEPNQYITQLPVYNNFNEAFNTLVEN